jgi:prolipoprotein diacylglyceryltransferase
MVADLLGIKLEFLKMVQTFGFFMAMSFLAASYTVSRELRRKEKNGLIHSTTEKIWRGKKASSLELAEAFIIAFLVAYKLVYVALNFSGFVNDTQGYILSMKGNLIAGLVAGIGYAYMRYREKEKQKLPEPKLENIQVSPHELVGNITLIAAGAGLLGAKIFDSLENFDAFLADPWGTLFSFQGLTVYGGLIFGAIAVLYYTHKKGIPILHMVDAAAPSMMIAYSVGRIGCQMSGDGDWGIVNTAPKPGWLSFLPDWMWSYNYPHNVIGDQLPFSDVTPIPGCIGKYCNMLSHPVFPTPFYETVMCAILFFILWSLRKRITTPGIMFCIYLMMNGVERFFIELIRVNTRYHFFGISASQAEIIAPLFFLTGLIGLLYFRKKASRHEPST